MDLLKLNKQGIIPGPSESEDDFFRRARYCLQFQEEMHKSLKGKVPFSLDEEVDRQVFVEGAKRAQDLYDIQPDWVPVFYSDYKLLPWHAGSAWIFQVTSSSPVCALMQLRMSLKSDKLSFYKRDEVLSHEVVHIGRMVFDEPHFEEWFAYQTSNVSWRRILGPIIQSSRESVFFVLVLLMIMLFDFTIIAWGEMSVWPLIVIAQLIPLGFVLVGLIRLRWRKFIFERCKKNIKSVVREDLFVMPTMYRLRDEEITRFAFATPNEITFHANKKYSQSLRWKVIVDAYFSAQ